MKIAVGTKNPAKINSTRIAFKKVFPSEKIVVVGESISSGISNQPMSDEEAIKGARTRAKGALKAANSDFGVGLEGGMHKIGNKWFDYGWAVIVNKKGEEGIGSSIRIEVPNRIYQLVKKHGELGYATDAYFKTVNSKQKQGYFGMMTNGKITRARGYSDGVIAALSRFLHKNLF